MIRCRLSKTPIVNPESLGAFRLPETKPAPESSAPRGPRSFGRYEVVEEIGNGAMGRVYRGFDPLVRRSVAIKTVRSEHLATGSADDYLRRFRREAQAAGRLSHPHIVSIYDVGEDYFVMEFLEGTTLEALLRQRVKLEVAEALRLLAPVADALDYAHKAGIVHRDIKPANIMVLAEGRPKLMDFGVAHLDASVMTRAGEILGSPSYMAPEQIAGGEEVSARSDLFSLAVVAYEAVTGRKPFEGTSLTNIIYRVVHEDAPPPRKWNFELPLHYDDVFRKALAKRPAERYPSATAFLDALNLKQFELGLTGVFADAGPAPPQEPAPAPVPQETLAGPPLGQDTLGASDAIAPAEPRLDPAAPGVRGPGRRRSRWLPPALGLGVLLGLAGAWALRRPADQAPAEVPAGGLRVETQPTGASVWLDGAEVGLAPLTLARVQPGAHTVRVALPGYAPAQLGFEVLEDARNPPLKFVLEALPAVPPAPPEPVSVRAHPPTPAARPTRPVKAAASAAPTAPAAVEPTAEPAAPALPPREGELTELTVGVIPPRRIAGDTPAYPKSALKLKLEGVVALDMVVTEDGTPTEIRVVESAGQILDEAALEAARTWRFEPALKDGVKVRVRWQVRQRFQIK
jgi:TonB family protein